VLAGENCVVIAAETGSGKTLSYMLPLMERLLRTQAQPRGAASGGTGSSSQASAVNTAGVASDGGGGGEAWLAGPTTVASLKARCTEAGVGVSGTKAELLARLAAAGEPQALAAQASRDAAAAAAASSLSSALEDYEPPAGEGNVAPRPEMLESLESYPRALVLCPNRELVQQVYHIRNGKTRTGFVFPRKYKCAPHLCLSSRRGTAFTLR
jgi:hypothetical protein